MSNAKEDIHPMTPYGSKPLISSGLSYVDACVKHVEEFGASKVYVLAGGTLSRKTDLLKRLQDGLGSKLVGLKVGMKPHTYMSECLDALREIKDLGADCIVTLGGGSLSDAAKFLTFAEANDATTKEKVLQLPHTMSEERSINSPRIPVILIPTTLSGGEYSGFAGVTDDDDDVKYQFHVQPVDIVILDGQVAVTTPFDTWTASGVRCIDHCCEFLATLLPPCEHWDFMRASAADALRYMVPGLLLSVQDPGNAEYRHKSQIGSVGSLVPLSLGGKNAAPGASHGIGHIMGPMYGVVHGKTSCVLMPAVHKYNAKVNKKEQEYVCEVLWEIPEAEKLFSAKGLKKSDADLGDLLDVIVRALNMPRTLADVGIEGEDKIWALARNSMKDPCTYANPIKITDPAQFYEILSACK